MQFNHARYEGFWESMDQVAANAIADARTLGRPFAAACGGATIEEQIAAAELIYPEPLPDEILDDARDILLKLSCFGEGAGLDEILAAL